MTGFPLPSGWSSKRLKYLATYNDEVLSESTDEEKEIDYVEISGVSLPHGIEEIERMNFGQAPSRARRKVRRNDILISTVRTYLRAIAKVDKSSSSLIASTGFCVVRPNDGVDSGFLGWALKSEPFVSEVVARSVGVSYPAINASELVTIGVPLPPHDTTQRRITRFLDEKTSRIDALIEQKRELLDRLAEKCQALITRTVTKGLNLEALMNLSGNQWIGEMPARYVLEVENTRADVWDSWKLSHAYRRIGSGTTPTSSHPDYYTVSGGTPWVTTTELRENYIVSTQHQVTEEALDDFSALRLYKSNSVMIAMYGATIGRLGMTKMKATCNQACCVFESSDQFDNRFLFYWLWHRRDDLIALSVGGGQPNLSQQDMKEERALCPPIEMQRKIANFLDKEIGKISFLKETIRKSIELLGEYRSALITAAVTGQIEYQKQSQETLDG